MKKIVLLSFIALSGQCQSLVKTGVITSSYDIEQSKKLGVFVQEYTPSQREFRLVDKTVVLEQVWVEKMWYYKNQQRAIHIFESLQGLVKMDVNSNLPEVKFDYSEGHTNGISGNKLTFRLERFPDTVEVVFKGKEDISILFIKT